MAGDDLRGSRIGPPLMKGSPDNDNEFVERCFFCGTEIADDEAPTYDINGEAACQACKPIAEEYKLPRMDS